MNKSNYFIASIIFIISFIFPQQLKENFPSERPIDIIENLGAELIWGGRGEGR